MMEKRKPVNGSVKFCNLRWYFWRDREASGSLKALLFSEVNAGLLSLHSFRFTPFSCMILHEAGETFFEGGFHIFSVCVVKALWGLCRVSHVTLCHFLSLISLLWNWDYSRTSRSSLLIFFLVWSHIIAIKEKKKSSFTYVILERWRKKAATFFFFPLKLGNIS